MPDPSRPSTSDSQVSTGEFDFAQPVPGRPRLKRRSLKTKSAAAKPAAAIPAESTEAKPTESAPSAPVSPAPETPRKLHTVSQTTGRQPDPLHNSNPSPSAQAHPSTLYYSSGARKEKEDAPPMKTSPSAATPASPIGSSSSAVRSSVAAPTRAASVVDYRANIERQAREQKSIGGLLSYVVYALLAFFVLGAILAGYGAYVVSKQLHQQSVTVSDLDKRYSAANDQLTAELKATNEALNQAQAQIGRQQDLITRQEDALNKLTTATDKLAATADSTESSLRLERQTRASEIASLRARMRVIDTRSGQ